MPASPKVCQGHSFTSLSHFRKKNEEDIFLDHWHAFQHAYVRDRGPTSGDPSVTSLVWIHQHLHHTSNLSGLSQPKGWENIGWLREDKQHPSLISTNKVTLIYTGKSNDSQRFFSKQTPADKMMALFNRSFCLFFKCLSIKWGSSNSASISKMHIVPWYIQILTSPNESTFHWFLCKKKTKGFKVMPFTQLSVQPML